MFWKQKTYDLNWVYAAFAVNFIFSFVMSRHLWRIEITLFILAAEQKKQKPIDVRSIALAPVNSAQPWRGSLHCKHARVLDSKLNWIEDNEQKKKNAHREPNKTQLISEPNLSHRSIHSEN